MLLLIWEVRAITLSVNYEKSKVKNIVMRKIISIIAIITGISFIAGCGNTKLDLKRTSMTVEIGSVISTNVDDYVNIENEKIKDDIRIDTSKVNTDYVGNGELVISYKKKEYIIEVDVKDTRGPVIVQKKFHLYMSEDQEEYGAEDLVSVSDPSGYTVIIEDKRIEGNKFVLKILAEDSYGNKTIKDIEVDVVDDRSVLEKDVDVIKQVEELRKKTMLGY